MGVVEWLHGEQPTHSLALEEIPDRQDDKKPDYGGHDGEHDFVGPCRGADAAQVEVGHKSNARSREDDVGNGGKQPLDDKSNVDAVEDGLIQVVKKHRPAHQKTQVLVKPSVDVGVC